MNKYVKIKGHDNWFLVLSSGQSEPEGLSEEMQNKITRMEVCKLHNPAATMDFTHRVILSAVHKLDYESLAKKYGTILIRPIGSFMTPIKGMEIVSTVYSNHFPIEDFNSIVICENDNKAERYWVKYLENRFPNKPITVINFFDLRSEEEVSQYFLEAEFITFATTFTKFEWFEKLVRNLKPHNKVIGYCIDSTKWIEALKIYPHIEIIKNTIDGN